MCSDTAGGLVERAGRRGGYTRIPFGTIDDVTDAPQAGYVLTWREDTDNLICLMIIRSLLRCRRERGAMSDWARREKKTMTPDDKRREESVMLPPPHRAIVSYRGYQN